MNYTKYSINGCDNDLYIIENFLNQEEVHKYLEYVENESQKDNIPFNNQTNFFNAKIKNPELSQKFYQKLEKINLVDPTDQDWIPSKPCQNIFMAKYPPGGIFNLHLDTGCHFLGFEKSYQTLLIYLNDDYQGGQTTFYNQNFEKVLTVEPKKGKAILFKIDLWHQAEPVLEGSKSWIGTEIVWSHNLS